MLTGLADGADRLLARRARAVLGAELAVVLPMPYELYRQDFLLDDSGSRRPSIREFEALVAEAVWYGVLPPRYRATAAVDVRSEDPAIRAHTGPHRAEQYRALGDFIAARAHELVAVWDGQPSRGPGGTAEVVERFDGDAAARAHTSSAGGARPPGSSDSPPTDRPWANRLPAPGAGTPPTAELDDDSGVGKLRLDPLEALAASGRFDLLHRELGRMKLRTARDPAQLNRVAVLALEVGNLAVAEKALLRGLELVGDHPRLRHNLGSCRYQQGRLEEAERAFRRALKQEPSSALGWVALGQVLLDRLDGDGAAACFDRAVTLDPECVDGHLGLAVTALSRGDHPAGLAAALAADGLAGSAETGAHVAEFLRLLGRLDESLDRARRGVLLTPDDPRIHFELANTLDALGRYAEAQRAYEEANRRSAVGPESIRHARRLRAELLETYRRLAGRPPEPLPELDRRIPVFVVGSPRSGTTLCDRLLASHPEVESVGETRLLQTLLQDAPGLWGRRRASPGEVIAHLWSEEGARFRRKMQAELLRRVEKLRCGSKSILVDKMPFNACLLGFLGAVAPGAVALQMIRDGRDVALSAWRAHFKQPLWHASSLEHAVEEWRSTLQLAEAATAFAPLRHRAVRYEALVGDPARVIPELFALIGLEPTEDWTRAHEATGVVRTHSAAEVRQPLHARSVGRSRSYPELREQMTEWARDELEALGYEPSTRAA